MRVTVHLRDGPNKTNVRSEALGEALRNAGEDVRYLPRGKASKDADLVVQTGFARSTALMDAIERRVPYIIMEEPFWRDFYQGDVASSWGYNGLAGGAWRPDPPDSPRPKPALKPMKTEGKTLIIGQKPTDHSLRGSDHVQWILDRRSELPEADFRPHPLMVPPNSLRPIREALSEYGNLVTYTSTVGAEGLVEGLSVRADHQCSLAYGVTDREEWLHALSWGQATHNRMGEIVAYILGGYEEALAQSHSGQYEIPRDKVDGQAVCQRYYREIHHIL